MANHPDLIFPYLIFICEKCQKVQAKSTNNRFSWAVLIIMCLSNMQSTEKEEDGQYRKKELCAL